MARTPKGSEPRGSGIEMNPRGESPPEQYPGEDTPKENKIRLLNSEIRPLKAELFHMEIRELAGKEIDHARKDEVETSIANLKKLKDKVKAEKDESKEA